MSTPSPTARCRHCDRLAAPWIEIQGQVRRVVLWCSSCNRAALAGSSYVPVAAYSDDELRRMPMRTLASTPDAPCEVCGSIAKLERHHLAPRNIFGDACERWPTVLVCRPCHEEWHRKVDGSIDRWRRARDAAQQRRAEQVRRSMETRAAMPWAQEERAANQRALAARKSGGSAK